MTRAVPLVPRLADQPQPGLVHQGGGLQRLPGGFAGQFVCRQLAQLMIDQRQEFLGSLGVALPNSLKHASDVTHVAPLYIKLMQMRSQNVHTPCKPQLDVERA